MNGNRFSPVYDHIKRQLIRDKPAYFVLDALASHADECGCCHPGVGLLAEETAYSDATVRDALLRLEAACLIRIDVTANERRKYPQVDYQIGPHVMFIGDDHQLRARRLWNAPRPLSHISETLDSTLRIDDFVTKESQQESEQESKQESGTRARTTTTTKTSPSNAKTASTRDGIDHKPQREPNTDENAEKAAQSAKTASARTETASADQENPPISAAPPISPRNGETDADTEAAISRVKNAAPMLALKQARALIERYGVAKVDATLAHLSKQKARNPAGLLKFYLDHDIVQADDVPQEPEIDNEARLRVFENFAAYRQRSQPIDPNQHLIDKMSPEQKAELENFRHQWELKNAKR